MAKTDAERQKDRRERLKRAAEEAVILASELAEERKAHAETKERHLKAISAQKKAADQALAEAEDQLLEAKKQLAEAKKAADAANKVKTNDLRAAYHRGILDAAKQASIWATQGSAAQIISHTLRTLKNCTEAAKWYDLGICYSDPKCNSWNPLYPIPDGIFGPDGNVKPELLNEPPSFDALRYRHGKS